VALDLGAVMDAIGTRLATISGLRVADYPSDAANPPQAIVSLPETVEYDTVMGRGADRVVIPVTVLVGRVSDRAARDALALYVSGSGASSVKSAVDGDLGGIAHTARVTGATVNIVTIQAVDYLGASFDVEVFD
jgi:hypothetical protein